MTVQLVRAKGSHARSHSRPARAYADRCIAMLGAELTAYIAGAGTVDEFDRWRAEPRRRRAIDDRLQAAFAVADTFAQANLLGAGAGWLREVGAAGLAERSPAQVLREGTSEDVKVVLDAAERFTRRH